jgi:acyl-coenzyme A thioesterase PaaI-like protein
MSTDTQVVPDNPQDVPQGFEPLFRKSPLTEPWEPLYQKKTEQAVIIGLRLARPHTNGRGLIHGGLIAALADNAMGYSCGQATGWTTSFVTISLAVDFVGSANV